MAVQHIISRASKRQTSLSKHIGRTGGGIRHPKPPGRLSCTHHHTRRGKPIDGYTIRIHQLVGTNHNHHYRRHNRKRTIPIQQQRHHTAQHKIFRLSRHSGDRHSRNNNIASIYKPPFRHKIIKPIHTQGGKHSCDDHTRLYRKTVAVLCHTLLHILHSAVPYASFLPYPHLPARRGGIDTCDIPARIGNTDNNSIRGCHKKLICHRNSWIVRCRRTYGGSRHNPHMGNKLWNSTPCRRSVLQIKIPLKLTKSKCPLSSVFNNFTIFMS